MAKFSPEYVRKYYSARLQGQNLAATGDSKNRCPFHEDKTASLSVSLATGFWKCHAGCGGGNMSDFEVKFSRCNRDVAHATISELTGAPQMSLLASAKPEATYQYFDAAGKLVFEKLRMPGKKFVARSPDEKGGYNYRLNPGKRPLYNLLDVLTAQEIFIAEGEKDCDNLKKCFSAVRPTGQDAPQSHPDALESTDRAAAISAPQKSPKSAHKSTWREMRMASTTNFDGAGKWKPEYSPYFAGKRVVIFPDNDQIGRNHATEVAKSIHGHALGVKIVHLPDIPAKGDVSDYLETHSFEELIELVKATELWHPEQQTQRMFITAAEFIVQNQSEEIDWLVKGVIQRGANGVICADPKGGKSWAALDMAISISLGTEFLGLDCALAKAAYISREDFAGLTAWRLRHLLAGKKDAQDWDYEKRLFVNSRKQTPRLMLDDEEQFSELLLACEHLRPDLLIMDVFNVMHQADENDNTEMRRVLERMSQISAATGGAVGIVHHFNKSISARLTQRMRGSSAIAGWAEWIIGIELLEDEPPYTRCMEFELKASQPPDRVHYRIHTDNEHGVSTLKRVDGYKRPERKQDRNG